MIALKYFSHFKFVLLQLFILRSVADHFSPHNRILFTIHPIQRMSRSLRRIDQISQRVHWHAEPSSPNGSHFIPDYEHPVS